MKSQRSRGIDSHLHTVQISNLVAYYDAADPFLIKLFFLFLEIDHLRISITEPLLADDTVITLLLYSYSIHRNNK